MNSTVLVLTLFAFAAPTQAAPVAPRAAEDPQEPQPVQPDTQAPAQPPPPPPSGTPAPPSSQPEAPPREVPPGQWVFTAQYGWVWMPHADSYTHVPADGGTPLMYVYYPASGWCWLVAPWIWGWGPLPFFGVLGCAHFGWWGWGFGHWFGFSGRHSHWGRGGWGYHSDGRWHYGPGPHGRGTMYGSGGPHGFAPRGTNLGSGATQSPSGTRAFRGSVGSGAFQGHGSFGHWRSPSPRGFSGRGGFSMGHR